MIKKAETLVYLDPIPHVYINRETGEKYKSVTTVISSIEHEFDVDGVATSISKQSDSDPKKNPLYIGMSKDRIVNYWKEINDSANEYGTHIHETVEKYLLSNKWFFPEDELELSVCRAYDELNIDEGVCMYPERVLFAEEYKLAGTTDLLIDIDDVFFDICDYKGLDINTPMFTKSGWKTMGTLTVNDKVYDMNGKICNISHISDIKNKKCYKIKFDNNETIISDFEHRWLISFYNHKKLKDIVMTTEELFNYLKNLNRKQVHLIPKVKITKPLINNKIDLPIDPYVLGIWLGDGHKVDNMSDKIWTEIEKRGYSLGSDISQGNSGRAQTRTIFNMRSELDKLKLLNNKHVPDIYLSSSYEQRLDLLRGFMDSDGYYNNSRKRFVMSTTREWQMIEFTKLVSSLGIKTTVIPCKKKCNGKIFNGYDICFSTNNLNPFLIRNQDFIEYTTIDNKSFKNIVSVELVESIPTRCIEVDSDTSTFLYGHTFSVTHNTNKVFNFFSPFKQTLKKPFEHLQDCQFVVYTLQLSVYALMYEMETGKKCRQLYAVHFNKETRKFSKIQLMYMRHEAEKLLKLHKYNTELNHA